MQSSSSEENDFDAMFPSEEQQSQNPPSSALFQPSELSPPHSQDPPGPDNVGLGNDDLMDTSMGPVQPSFAAVDQVFIGDVASNGNAQKNEPGWAWKNKKATDEYNRAMEMVVDKSFNLSQYSVCA